MWRKGREVGRGEGGNQTSWIQGWQVAKSNRHVTGHTKNRLCGLESVSSLHSAAARLARPCHLQDVKALLFMWGGRGGKSSVLQDNVKKRHSTVFHTRCTASQGHRRGLTANACSFYSFSPFYVLEDGKTAPFSNNLEVKAAKKKGYRLAQIYWYNGYPTYFTYFNTNAQRRQWKEYVKCPFRCPSRGQYVVKRHWGWLCSGLNRLRCPLRCLYSGQNTVKRPVV